MRAFPADADMLVNIFGLEGQFEELKVDCLSVSSHSALLLEE
jgi:hypothetical protein